MRVLETACFEVSFITSYCDVQADSRPESSEALACRRSSDGEPKTEATSSYSMDNNMIPSVRQQNRVIMCNACHDICMSPVCCFEVASGSRSSQSLACCRALEHKTLYILFARPPAASSTSLTCLADAAVFSDFSISHKAQSTAVY